MTPCNRLGSARRTGAANRIIRKAIDALFPRGFEAMAERGGRPVTKNKTTPSDHGIHLQNLIANVRIPCGLRFAEVQWTPALEALANFNHHTEASRLHRCPLRSTGPPVTLKISNPNLLGSYLIVSNQANEILSQINSLSTKKCIQDKNFS